MRGICNKLFICFGEKDCVNLSGLRKMLYAQNLKKIKCKTFFCFHILTFICLKTCVTNTNFIILNISLVHGKKCIIIPLHPYVQNYFVDFFIFECCKVCYTTYINLFYILHYVQIYFTYTTNVSETQKI